MNYLLLAQAIEHYKQHSFEYIEVPWVVPRDITNITCPPGRELYPLGNEGDLVASAEQSFLQLIVKGLKLNRRLMAITPCFRDDKLDKYHQRYFMKLELISNKMVLEPALAFFEKFVKCRVVATNVDDGITESSWDIEAETRDGWIELGSYGSRKHPLAGSWCYGTGCAEPRLSIVLGGQ